jgi:hypothetical protein
MQALHKTNDLIPDPKKLKTTVIPAEDIAGWFLPFEIVFGMVYWERIGMYVLLMFVATILFGWIIPMQQRYALLAKAEFMIEKTQLAHLVWTEQCELLKMEPILEPAYKVDEKGKVMMDDDKEPIADELDLDDWVTELDMEGRIIEHDDGMLASIHTLDNKYIASLFQRIFNKRQETTGQFEYDKVGWTTKLLKILGLHALTGFKWFFTKSKQYAPVVFAGTKRGGREFGGWLAQHKLRFAGAIVLGTVLILFGNWIYWGMQWLFSFLGWAI